MEKSKNIAVYDNGGKTFDRYTIFVGKDVYAMSGKPLGPLGFNQYLGSYPEQVQKGSHLGKKIEIIPGEILKAIKLRYH